MVHEFQPSFILVDHFWLRWRISYATFFNTDSSSSLYLSQLNLHWQLRSLRLVCATWFLPFVNFPMISIIGRWTKPNSFDRRRATSMVRCWPKLIPLSCLVRCCQNSKHQLTRSNIVSFHIFYVLAVFSRRIMNIEFCPVNNVFLFVFQVISTVFSISAIRMPDQLTKLHQVSLQLLPTAFGCFTLLTKPIYMPFLLSAQFTDHYLDSLTHSVCCQTIYHCLFLVHHVQEKLIRLSNTDQTQNLKWVHQYTSNCSFDRKQ